MISGDLKWKISIYGLLLGQCLRAIGRLLVSIEVNLGWERLSIFEHLFPD